jgi:hypothetical protein
MYLTLKKKILKQDKKFKNKKIYELIYSNGHPHNT